MTDDKRDDVADAIRARQSLANDAQRTTDLGGRGTTKVYSDAVIARLRG